MRERARQSVNERERDETKEAFPERIGRAAVKGASQSEGSQTETTENQTDDVLDVIDEVLSEVPSPEEIDLLMREIDATLETNPEQFVHDFRQVNGQ